MLEFIEEGHIYKYEGRVVPSVTQVLDGWQLFTYQGRRYYFNTISDTVVEAETLEKAGEFGTAIHKAMKFILTGQGLDYQALDPDLAPPLSQLTQWLDDFGVIVKGCEKPRYSVKRGFAGTDDIDCVLPTIGKKALAIVDVKTTDQAALVGPQTAGYEILLREETGYTGPLNRYCLTLPKDGSAYKFKRLDNPLDKDFFLCSLFRYNYLTKLGG